jgi:hypothetical protein
MDYNTHYDPRIFLPMDTFAEPVYSFLDTDTGLDIIYLKKPWSWDLVTLDLGLLLNLARIASRCI